MKNIITYSTFFFILSLTSFSIHAQSGITIDGGNFTVQDGAILTVEGDVNWTAPTNIAMEGILQFTGDWINQSNGGSIQEIEGFVQFKGNQQVISDNWVNFQNLDMSDGFGEIILANDLYFNTQGGIIDLGNWALQLMDNNLVILGQPVDPFNVENGFIINENPAGEVRYANLAGAKVNSSFSVPFGTIKGIQIPVSFEITDLGISANNSFEGVRLYTYPTDPTQAINNRALPDGVNHFNNNAGVENADKAIDRFWGIIPFGYSTNPSATFNLSYKEEEWNASNGSTNKIDESQLIGWKWDINSKNAWQNISGTVNTATNQIQLDEVELSESAWTLIDQSSNALPLEWGKFTANLDKNNQVLLNWNTLTEQDVAYFTVQHSIDGQRFTDIGKVAATGNSQSLQSYQFIDKHATNGKNYYRIQLTNNDQSIAHSTIQMVAIKTMTTFSVFPNPVAIGQPLSVQLNTNDWIHFKLINADGKVVVQERQIVIAGNTLKIDCSNCVAGTYWLKVDTAEGSYTEKIVVK